MKTSEVLKGITKARAQDVMKDIRANFDWTRFEQIVTRAIRRWHYPECPTLHGNVANAVVSKLERKSGIEL